MKNNNNSNNACEIDWKLVIKIASCLFASFVVGMAIGAIMTSCTKINAKFGLKDDNVIEEIIEEVVESKTGIDIDFTPSSSEEYGSRKYR